LTIGIVIRIMHIRMTTMATALTALVAAAAALSGAAGIGSPEPGAERTALVMDAADARHGRELVDPRLRDLDAEVRLPRTPQEARTNVLYFEKLGYRVVVTGRDSSAAARWYAQLSKVGR
jgi:hypothetical protein